MKGVVVKKDAEVKTIKARSGGKDLRHLDQDFTFPWKDVSF